MLSSDLRNNPMDGLFFNSQLQPKTVQLQNSFAPNPSSIPYFTLFIHRNSQQRKGVCGLELFVIRNVLLFKMFLTPAFGILCVIMKKLNYIPHFTCQCWPCDANLIINFINLNSIINVNSRRTKDK